MHSLQTPSPVRPPSKRRAVSLALQGGGSHGAFTWGVLDALLEDGRLTFDGISGASAGAVNAVAMAHGLATARAAGGDEAAARAAARKALERVWRRVASLGAPGAMAQRFARLLLGGASGERLRASLGVDTASRWASPYQINPLDINPLRSLLGQEIDFAALSQPGAPRVFVSATQVRTGRAEIFHGERLTLSAVMASACLPTVFQAVTIDGEDYWDGGFSANPALQPLVNGCDSADIVLVQLNPLTHAETPHTPQDITMRMNELAFNASLMSQMRSIAFTNERLADGRLQEGAQYRPMRLHRIDLGSAADTLPASSKLSTDSAQMDRLFESGRLAAAEWLATHFTALGKRSTVDIEGDYLPSEETSSRASRQARA
ncbi:patatin-like phospholipase family protein [Variovorax sp. PAMC 28711]|uniref:patatin-like phospholipase family protein n=1 Tax=Variovorax sp. PAMC 28711 TaxID=1795631 RepID=UPI00078BDF93|nr:patatin-like phospholipase family protein [Variovorax sp. PAMC 28711]AMM26766.1 patatin [Variovorax sp. PAMC 28711]